MGFDLALHNRDTLEVFNTTELDKLVLGNFYIKKI